MRACFKGQESRCHDPVDRLRRECTHIAPLRSRLQLSDGVQIRRSRAASRRTTTATIINTFNSSRQAEAKHPPGNYCRHDHSRSQQFRAAPHSWLNPAIPRRVHRPAISDAPLRAHLRPSRACNAGPEPRLGPELRYTLSVSFCSAVPPRSTCDVGADGRFCSYARARRTLTTDVRATP